MAITVGEEVVSKTGTKFPRARAAGLSYVHGETPYIEWWMEFLTAYSDGTVETGPWLQEKIRGDYTPGLTYPLIHPQTGAEIGTASDDALFAHLFSRWHYDLTQAQAKIDAETTTQP